MPASSNLEKSTGWHKSKQTATTFSIRIWNMIDNMPVEKAVCCFLGKRRQTRSERGAQRGKEKSGKYNASFEGYHVCTL